MVNPFTVCGSRSFPQEDEDEQLHNQHRERQVRSTDSSPRISTSSSKCSKSWRRSITNTNGHKKNPFSDRGLDKFSALLENIEEKREKIYSQFPPEEIAFVQFDFSKDNNGKPIVVVKAKPKDEEQIIQKKTNSKSTTTFDDRRQYHSGPLDHNHHHRRRCCFKQNHNKNHIKLAISSSLEKSRITATTATAADEVVVESNQVDDKMKSTSSDDHHQHRNLALKKKMRKPGCYMSATLILILILLALFGRSVAIMCTSIGWYTVSNLGGKRRPLKRNSTKKKRLLGSGSNSCELR